MEIVSQEENNLWKTMLKEMKMRHHRDCRKLYYPFKMHVWDRENKEIEANYRNKISNLINERRKVEKVEEENRNVIEAAETLLLFAQTAKKRFNDQVTEPNKFYTRRIKNLLVDVLRESPYYYMI